jgi:[NiFe] hydrogenase diaphorase moiety large subunit
MTLVAEACCAGKMALNPNTTVAISTGGMIVPAAIYAFLNAAPQGRFVVRLCRTITCDMAGKDRVARQLENDLKIKFGETTPDGRFTLEWANCLGMCDQGPALLVNDQVLTKVTPEQVHEILEACRKSFSPHALAGKEEHHS